ncbi:MAG TPA: FAD-dependent monooxygenase [Candidatus Acidoferrum sp.]|nr:FAD-dependent monooxygenase [Candidatus Acidoferrum sp.]
MDVLIAGGGIGGLAAALGLARNGIAVRVLEKSPAFGEIGAGLQLAPNASWALDRLGVLDAISLSAVRPRRLVWMDALAGTELTELDLGARFVERYGYPYVVMHRSDLLAVLLEGCRAQPRIALEPSKEVVQVEDRGDGVRVRCGDGSSYEGDLLVGADGLWSSLRKLVVDDGDPICSEYVAYRGALPIEQVTARASLDDVVLWTGPQMHFVQYPLRRGELYNQVAVFKSRRYRPDRDDWGTPDELDERFGAAGEQVRRALASIKRNRRWPMYDRLPIDAWTRGRVTLLGDAAHPMLQYLAQGACQALEDAVILADALAVERDLDAALARYERERVPRTSQVQRLARAWGDYWHLDPGPDLDARNAFLRHRPPDDFSDTDWFYGYGRAFDASHASSR